MCENTQSLTDYPLCDLASLALLYILHYILHFYILHFYILH